MNMRKTTQVFFTLAAALLLATCLTGCTSRFKEARAQRAADRYFAQTNYSKAEIEYLIVAQLDNANSHAMSQLATIYFDQGRFRRAYAYGLRASQLSTNNVDLHVKLATIYLTAHKLKEAHDEAAWILAKSPTNTVAPEILAESVSSLEELHKVRDSLDKLSKQIGDTPPVEVAYSVLYYALNDLKSSEAAAQRALAMDPKSASAYSILASVYVAQHKLKEADAAFKNAADLSPIRSARRLSYANFKIRNGELEEGKRLVQEITDKAPDYVPAWLRSAEIALAEKRFSDCDKLISQALSRDPDNYEALLLRGRLDLVQDQVDKAVGDFDHMATLYDRSPEAQYYLALAHLGINDPGRAATDLNKALFLQPGNPEATVLLAQLNVRKGDTSAAITSLTDLLKKRPGIAEAYLLLANAYFAQKDYDQAVAVYDQMTPYFPKSPQIPLFRGAVLERQKKFAEARKNYEKALEMAPNLITAQEDLMNLDIADENYAAAFDRVDKVRKQNPGPAADMLLAKVHIAHANSITTQAAKTNRAVRRMADVPATQDDVKQAEAALLRVIDAKPDLSEP